MTSAIIYCVVLLCCYHSLQNMCSQVVLYVSCRIHPMRPDTTNCLYYEQFVENHEKQRPAAAEGCVSLYSETVMNVPVTHKSYCFYFLE